MVAKKLYRRKNGVTAIWAQEPSQPKLCHAIETKKQERHREW